jgi:intein/homing endonuclease
MANAIPKQITVRLRSLIKGFQSLLAILSPSFWEITRGGDGAVIGKFKPWVQFHRGPLDTFSCLLFKATGSSLQI